MKTDIEIADDVAAEMEWDPAIDPKNIRVAASDGIVTLSGEVATFAEKFCAERAAQRVAGVKAIAVELTVARSNLYDRTDTDIARSAETALQYVSFLKEDSIKVMVESGWITLTGAVDWDYQRRNVWAALRYLSGVKGITDQVTIHTRSPSTAIRVEIIAALGRRVDAASQHIGVAVSEGDVTLTGTVTSWWQKELAREAAWNCAGVTQVQNHLEVRV